MLLLHDRTRHLVGLDLVRVAGFADGHLSLNTVAVLLHDVRQLMGE